MEPGLSWRCAHVLCLNTRGAPVCRSGRPCPCVRCPRVRVPPAVRLINAGRPSSRPGLFPPVRRLCLGLGAARSGGDRGPSGPEERREPGRGGLRLGLRGTRTPPRPGAERRDRRRWRSGGGLVALRSWAGGRSRAHAPRLPGSHLPPPAGSAVRTELRLERARGGPAPGRRRRYHGHARLRTCARPRPRPSSAHQAPGPRAPAEPEAPGAHCPPRLRPPGPAGLQRATWWGVRAPAESHPGEDAARGPARQPLPLHQGRRRQASSPSPRFLAVSPLPRRLPASSPRAVLQHPRHAPGRWKGRPGRTPGLRPRREHRPAKPCSPVANGADTQRTAGGLNKNLPRTERLKISLEKTKRAACTCRAAAGRASSPAPPQTPSGQERAHETVGLRSREAAVHAPSAWGTD